MNDPVIRKSLLDFLAKTKNDPNTILVSEMGLSEGKAIIDVAMINGIMCGYEIKSDVDTLYRLDRQIETYKKYFQKLTVVTTKSHLAKVRQKCPPWVGIMLAYEEDGIVHIRQLRQAKLNKKTSKQEITSLMWRDEARAILHSRGVKGISSAPRSQLWYQISELCDESELIAIVKDTMRSRRAWQVVG
jgi:hypothetical protein